MTMAPPPVDGLAHVKRAPLIGSAHRPTMAAILDAVAEETGIGPVELKGLARSRHIARPRQIAMWLARQLTLHSLPEIGRALGSRDHTTVLHGIRKIDELRARHAGLRRQTDML